MKELTFGQKIFAGFAVVVALAVLIGLVANFALGKVVSNKDRVIANESANLALAERMHAAIERKVGTFRGYLITQDESFLARMQDARAESSDLLATLRRQSDKAGSLEAIQRIEQTEAEHQAALEKLVALRKAEAALDTINKQFAETIVPIHERLKNFIKDYIDFENRALEVAKASATAVADDAKRLVATFAILAIVLALAVAFFLTSSLSRQIGAAVHHMHGSSAELQAAANQQATGAREQSTAMNEITTTISELLATSRQIAESAKRVSGIAEETAGAARAGDATVQLTQESITGIKRQVDVIVNYMLDLGRKSQQIGGILEIINELAEQTNILSINATIEAAGAGESGKRFAVVADEIRKLADRVGGSTKDIRVLIEEIRAAVNTTVMATEGGTKAVDLGTRQFTDVAVALRQIGAMVSATTEASKEIGLSTKQQATAVEQVNIAIANVAQATKETEVSSAQMLQTASQLAGLARDLTRIVQPSAIA